MQQIKAAKTVSFNDVQIFHFNRTQGFTCIPTRGGSTLGMQAQHSLIETCSVSDHERFRRFQRYSTLLRYYLEGKIFLTPQQSQILENCVQITMPSQNPDIENAPSDFASSEKNNQCLSLFHLNHGKINNSDASFILSTNEYAYFDDGKSLKRKLDDSKDDAFYSHSESYLIIEKNPDFLNSLEDYYFMQPISIKKRRLLLRRAGLEKIDFSEKVDCQKIRLSRAQCGCDCENGFCEPETCECSLNGISCQVDRIKFPCSCGSESQCRNPSGRIEFNSIRVKAHYLHTRMKLERASSQENACSKNNSQIRDSEIPTWSNTSNAGTEIVNSLLKTSNPPIDSLSTENDAGKSEEFLAALNTTLHGCCYQCQNDRSINVLMRELAEREKMLPSNEDSSESSNSSNSLTFKFNSSIGDGSCDMKNISSPVEFNEFCSSPFIGLNGSVELSEDILNRRGSSLPYRPGATEVQEVEQLEVPNNSGVCCYAEDNTAVDFIDSVPISGSRNGTLCSNHLKFCIPVRSSTVNSKHSLLRLDPITSIFHHSPASFPESHPDILL